jgi:glycosyltransferase involved in cell wall biosynthesis
MIECGFADKADMVFVNAHLHKQYVKIKLSRNVCLHFCPGKKDYKNLDDKYKTIFIRGNYNEYPDVLAKVDYGGLIYYAADSDFYPKCIDPKRIDLFLADEKSHAREIEEKYPGVKTHIFDKIIDESVFKPVKAKKEFDICFTANFSPWKNHNLLCSQIKKSQTNPRVVFVGNLLGQEQRVKTLAWKYGINAVFTGLVEPTEAAKFLSKSKLSVFPQELDANPRTLTESLAAGIPVVVNSEMTGGVRLVNNLTGVKTKPEKMHLAIKAMMKDYKKYKPDEYYKKELTNDKIIKRLISKISKI